MLKHIKTSHAMSWLLTASVRAANKDTSTGAKSAPNTSTQTMAVAVPGIILSKIGQTNRFPGSNLRITGERHEDESTKTYLRCEWRSGACKT